MKTNIEKKIIDFLKISIVVTSLYYILVFIFISLSRISYPFELEMMEGAMLENTIRLIEGKEIYTKPTMDYIPFIYPPLFFYLSEISVKIFGESFFSLRILSFLSTILSFFLIFKLIIKETENWIFGLSAAGLFAGVYQITGFWFDLARVDSLFLMLILATIYIIRVTKKDTGLIYAAIIASLAYLTKQTTFIIIFPMLIYLIFKFKARSLFFIIPFVFAITLTTIILNKVTDGWYFFWIFELPSSHQWILKYIISFWSYDIFKHTALMFLVSIMWIIFLIKNSEKNDYIFFSMAMIGIILSSWLQRLHLGGFVNANIPAYALLTITFLSGINYFLKNNDLVSELNINKYKIILFLIIFSQLLSLNYNPTKAIPTKEDRAAGENLINKIKEFKGEVYIPNHSYLNRYAGKKSFASWVGYLDLMISKSELKYELESEFEEKLKQKYFDAIITNTTNFHHFIEKYYGIREEIFHKEVFFTISQRTRPEYIYVPKK